MEPSSVLNWEVIRFIDWAGIMIFGDLPRSHGEGLIALSLQLIWVGALGVVFAFLILQITSQGYLLKGFIYALTVGFLIYAVPTVFQVPILKEASLVTVVSNKIGAVIWGLAMSKTLHWLDRRFSLATAKVRI
jgi:predicted membrane-bound dolichyl-phosphate-mannose-protein mannosyltransferase